MTGPAAARAPARGTETVGTAWRDCVKPDASPEGKWFGSRRFGPKSLSETGIFQFAQAVRKSNSLCDFATGFGDNQLTFEIPEKPALFALNPEYIIASNLSPGDILDKMVSGKVRLYKFTIPEGSNLNQIAEIIDSAGLANRQEFLQLANDTRFIENMGNGAVNLEGYLFPDTYFFPRNVAAERIIESMVDRLQSEITDDWRQRASEINFTMHEVITLASIIEKETGTAAERPIISSVFHNRLKKKMRLETDPTVIYGIKDFDGNLTRKHLETKTPYNTYRISGLPPGPIASPGRAAIEAALYPAKTSYLFFVSKKDGTHQFSTNLADHNRAIRKYQLRRR